VTPSVAGTDTTAALQGAGSVGLSGYLSGSATSPVAVRLTSFSAVPVGGAAPTVPSTPTTPTTPTTPSTPTTPTAPANTAPTAAFAVTTAALTVSVDGAGSTDADGTVAGYAWEFGDTSTGTGATASHSYTAAGTYTVALTVTDDDGATARTQQTVTVTAPAAPVPPATVLAVDGFGRSVTGGLGTADTGGAWTVAAGAARQSVSAGTATFAMTKGTNTGSYLGGVSAVSSDVQASFSLSAVPTGGGAYVYVTARQVAVNTSYAAQVRVLADGSVGVSLVRFAGTSDAVLIGKEVVVKGVTYTAGMVLRVDVQASGTGTTNLSATVWADGSAQPVTPSVAGTDTTAALQGAGSVGLSGYLSGSATSPVAVRLTSFTAGALG
jgi:PKD repeat protein